MVQSAGRFFQDLERFVENLEFYVTRGIRDRNLRIAALARLEDWRAIARGGIDKLIHYSPHYIVGGEFSEYMEELIPLAKEFVEDSERFLASIPDDSELRMYDEPFDDTVWRLQTTNGVIHSAEYYQRSLRNYREVIGDAE